MRNQFIILGLVVCMMLLPGPGGETAIRQVMATKSEPMELAGSFALPDSLKTREPSDKKQQAPRMFQKKLSVQNFVFHISTTGEGSFQQLTIVPSGLKTDNKKIETEIEGHVTDAEIEDLNADGFPEILIYACSAGSGSYGRVIGYSVNRGKSISQITFPNLADHPTANHGYMGHDQFRIVGSDLVRHFPVYNPADANSHPTGGSRRIHYKLKEGEASRIFVIDKIVEYPSK